MRSSVSYRFASVLLAASFTMISVPRALLAGDADLPAVTVHQVGRAFSAVRIALSRGQVVHFENDDRFTHNIFIDSPDFRYESGLQPSGTAKDITFTQSGSFTVLCAIHPQMELTVDVQ